MITTNKIQDITKFVKGENYTINVTDYNEGMNQAVIARTMINEQFATENPNIFTTIFPFRKRDGRYCIEVWMEYTDMTSVNDIRVRFFFEKNYFGAARNIVTKRITERENNERIYNMFGF